MRRTEAAGTLTLHVNPTGDLRAATVACEREVFAERYRRPLSELVGCYDAFDASSAFLSVADDHGAVVAMARVGFPSPVGLATVYDLAHDPWRVDGLAALALTGLDLRTTCDVSTIAVRSGARATAVSHSATIYHGLVQMARANGITGFVALLDLRVRRALASLGLVMHTIPGTTTESVWGSPAMVAVWADVAEMVDGQRRRAPDAYRLVTLGNGLGEVHLPPLEAFRVGPGLPGTLEVTTPRPRTEVDLRASADDELLRSWGVRG